MAARRGATSTEAAPADARPARVPPVGQADPLRAAAARGPRLRGPEARGPAAPAPGVSCGGRAPAGPLAPRAGRVGTGRGDVEGAAPRLRIVAGVLHLFGSLRRWRDASMAWAPEIWFPHRSARRATRGVLSRPSSRAGCACGGSGARRGTFCGRAAVWKSTSASMMLPCRLRRAARNRHPHAIEQAPRRWRRGRRGDSAWTP